MAALGPCNATGPLTVVINEVSTVAGVFSLAQYINPGTNSPGSMTLGAPNTTQAQVGLTNAFNTVGLIEQLPTGFSNFTTQVTNPGVATVARVQVSVQPETTKVNHIANILATCVNQATATGGNCASLFGAAVPPPSALVTSQPSASFAAAVDTLQAAYYMAVNPTDVSAYPASPTDRTTTSTTNLNKLYTLPSGAVPFQPGLSAQPTDWTIGIVYYSGGTTCSNGAPFINYSYQNSIDAAGNIWMANGGSSTTGALTQMSPLGVPLACSGVVTGSRGGAAIDPAGNVWIASNQAAFVYRFDGTNTVAFPIPTGTATSTSYNVAADALGNIFYSDTANKLLYEIPGGSTVTAANATTAASTLLGSLAAGTATAIAFDKNNTVYLAENNASSINYFALTSPLGTTNNTYTTGASLTSSTNYTSPVGLALDAAGDMWVSNSANGSTSPGQTTSYVTPTYTTAGTTQSVAFAQSTPTAVFEGGLQTGRQISIDGAGNVWSRR